MSGIGVMIGASTITLALQPFVQRAANLFLDDCSFVLSMKDNIRNLQDTFLLIESFLEEMKDKQVESDAIRNWLRQLVDIGYEARDVLDEYYTVTAPFVKERMASRSVSSSLSLSSSATVELPLQFRYRIAEDIKSVTMKLDRMKKNGEFLKLLKSVGGGGAGSTTPDSRPESTFFFDKQKKNSFVGRKKEKEEIIKKLLDDSTNNVRVVPIWGMGGIGKTTLARSIYHDVEVNKKYPSQNKFWLSVGNKKFSGRDIMSKIVGEYNANVPGSELAEKLVEKFNGEKFLIVLDDVWDLATDEWELLWTPLTNVGKGGCIVITTREKKVFTGKGIPVLEEEEGIKPLSDDDCWLIFESHAFEGGNSDIRPDLKEVGQEIVKKLKGLPLAAEVVGRSLLNEQNVEAWKDFLKVDDNEGTIKNKLRWSYNRLKSHLKQCFAYCSLFPKDHVFDEKVLIKMWMAHDFIQRDGRLRLEDIGGSYFKELVHASLFQSVDGKYMMHDMIHDLALVVSDEEFTMVNGSPNIDARHVSIASDLYNRDQYLKNLQLCRSKRILTIYTIDYLNLHNEKIRFANDFLDEDIFRDILQQLKSIRVLVLVSYAIKDIPDCISDLIHLRYLDLCKTGIKSLPDCLCKLHNLQTVAIPLDAVLPKNIVNMANLRHLQANLTIYNGFGNLTSLQEVSSISISKDLKIRELREMPKQLRGKLVIRGLENVTNLQDAGQVSLQDKVHINQLELVREDKTKFMTEEVLNVLSCPPNLTDLIIDGYNGLNFPKWMREGGFFAELRTLKLSNWTDLKLREHDGYNGLLMSEGWMEWVVNTSVEDISVSVSIMRPSNVMRSLSKLTITSCDGLTVLKVDALVSLKYLWIVHCSNLTTISFGATVEEVQVFLCKKLNRMESESTSSLKTLCIQGCEKLRSLGNMDLQKIDSLKHLTVLGCPELMIEEASTSSSPSTSLSTLRTDNVVVFTKVFEYNNHVSLGWMSIIDFGFEHFSESVVNKLTLLQYLGICNCKNLKSLSREFQNLTSLKKLEIRVCPQLQLLPTDGLPLSLKSLEVHHCPKLQEQCRKDSEHWDKFMHIPDIKLISKNTLDFPQGLNLKERDSLTLRL